MERPPSIPDEEMIEKDSGINRVVGFEPGKEEAILERFEGRFEQNRRYRDEIEKTPVQRALISRANHDMKAFLEPYGIVALDITAQNVHVFDKAKVIESAHIDDRGRLENLHGSYNAAEQSIKILEDKNTSGLAFSQTLTHEMLHLQGFFSYQKSTPEVADTDVRHGRETSSVNTRRAGFAVGTNDGKKLLFNDINESVITELEIRFEKEKMSKWPELQDEITTRDEYVRRTAEQEWESVEEAQKFTAGIKDKKLGIYKKVNYAYHSDRLGFNKLIDDIYEKNQDDFESREDVFKMFAAATLTGRLLPVARLIEKTFGKGSFRKLGEKTAKIMPDNPPRS